MAEHGMYGNDSLLQSVREDGLLASYLVNCWLFGKRQECWGVIEGSWFRRGLEYYC